MVGKIISHYKIIGKIGEGGMGVVYKAEDLDLKRFVALKFLPSHIDITDAEEGRFLQEAQSAAILQHPNICVIHSISRDSSDRFIDMEYIDGDTLKQKLKSSAIPVDDAISYAIQIGEALLEAHGKDIVHRDIKSENIMVTADKRIKVMDFGLAKLKGSLKLTKTSSTVGTLSYMAPEQLQGAEADARTDIFSYGVVLYEILTGRLPFRGEHEAAMIYSILNEEPAQPNALRPEIPSRLSEIVTRLLQKDPSGRYQAVRDIIPDLKKVTSASEPSKDAGITSIAVLAFGDMSPEKDQDYLCEGLAEEIINALTKIKHLRVSARTSAFAFKGKQLDVRDIGNKLNVQTVLEGSVRKSGTRLRITAQLINVSDGYHLWSERYDRELKDVFEIQDEITENVVRALKLVLGEKDKRMYESVPTPEVEAYEYYLRGRRLFYLIVNGYRESIKMFEQAIEIDPRYALAYCGLADCHSWRYMYIDSSETSLIEAEKASRKAIEINVNLAEAHTSLGLAISLRKKYDLAQQEFEKAIALNPRLFEVYYFYGRMCFAQGNFKKAAESFEEAVKVRPDDYQVPLLLSAVYRSLNDETKYQETVRTGLQKAERHLELNPKDVRALYLGGGALWQLGERKRGEEWVERALHIDPNGTGTLYNSACFYALAGQQEQAINCLERALKNGFAHREWIEHDSDLDSIRSHPRYPLLLQQLK